ncbi:nitrilase-related carbon-nitrogen hydrolase [Nocardia yamanashiensis]|uniref:nitrilase-related carbon-nitrogen hydrolase n=1 Tax=Nocardia yamanashiensis TaxID=209247 RepID=UPI000834F423|nr:nitrilase-related carbon-nitrogen hydrolase [Nocardia yamanashiensis]
MQRFAVGLIAVLASAGLWWVGWGLHPVPGVAVLAALPVLLLVPRTDARWAFVAAFSALLIGELRWWPYFVETLEQPQAVTVLLLVGSAAVFGAAVLVGRALLVRGRIGLAAVAVPAVWVSFEYLLAAVGPFGAWWSVAYSQAAMLPVVRVAALTGVWGISFAVLLGSSAIAALAAPGVFAAQRIRVAVAVLVAVVAAGGFGGWQAARSGTGESVRVGLVGISQPPDFVPVDSPEGRDMIERAVREIDRLADQGAEVVVLPEKAWRADESSLAGLSEALRGVAVRRNIHVVAGLVLTTGETSVNAAIDYPSGVRYAKHYLVPGLEDDLVPGNEFQLAPGRPWALAVCFDLDRPALVRENARRGATLLLVPALDFTDDAWLHSRMAVVRGMESGVAVARAPQLGELVLSDAGGEILASARTDITVTRSVVATVPLSGERTPYARFGDWFAWLSLALSAVALLFATRRRPADSGVRESTAGDRQYIRPTV